MPLFQTTTKESRSVWKSPDGQREIFEVTLDYQGQTFKAKTYSRDISVVGFIGEVESYEKEGRNGSETFVKQAPKEGFSSGSSSYPSKNSDSNRHTYTPKDEKAIQAMWAIGQSIAAHNGNTDMDVANLESVKAFAVEVFGMVDDVKTGGVYTPQEPEVVHEVVENEQVDMTAIDAIFKKNESDTGDKPWNKNSTN